MPVYRVKRHKTWAVRIAELTEDLEELCSEKALLLQKFEYAEDAGAEAFRKVRLVNRPDMKIDRDVAVHLKEVGKHTVIEFRREDLQEAHRADGSAHACF